MTPGKIQHLLEIHSENRNRPDGNAYISLSFSAECRIAEQTGHSLKEIELQALNNNIVPERYSATRSLCQTGTRENYCNLMLP